MSCFSGTRAGDPVSALEKCPCDCGTDGRENRSAVGVRGMQTHAVRCKLEGSKEAELSQVAAFARSSDARRPYRPLLAADMD